MQAMQAKRLSGKVINAPQTSGKMLADCLSPTVSGSFSSFSRFLLPSPPLCLLFLASNSSGWEALEKI